MICICHKRQLEVLARFQHLPTNLGPGLTIPANLLPNANALSSALSGTNAALSAPAALGAGQAAASPAAQAAAAAALGANPQMQSVAALNALASGAAAMSSGMGLNMLSPGAAPMAAGMWPMIGELARRLALLPLSLNDKLAELAKVGELVEKLEDELDVDLDSPQWADDAAATVGEKLGQAQENVQEALKTAQQGVDGASLPASSALANANVAAIEQATIAAQAQAVEAATASAQTGLGVDLAAPDGMAALAQKLGQMNATANAMPSSMDPASTATILAAMQALASIDTIKRTLGVDLLAPGAGGDLNARLQALSNSLSQSGPLTSSLNGATSAMSGALGSGAAAGGAAGGAGSAAGGAASAGASPSAGASAGATASLSASATGAAPSPLSVLGAALAPMLAGVSGPPSPWLLVVAFAKQCESTLGIQLIMHGPC